MPETPMVNEATLTVRRPELLGPVLGRVVGMLAARAQCPIDRLDDALLLTDGALTVVVSDEGRGILPRPDSPGLGLGLPLIATLAESLELGTGDDEQTEVRMSFRLGAAALDESGAR